MYIYDNTFKIYSTDNIGPMVRIKENGKTLVYTYGSAKYDQEFKRCKSCSSSVFGDPYKTIHRPALYTPYTSGRTKKYYGKFIKIYIDNKEYYMRLEDTAVKAYILDENNVDHYTNNEHNNGEILDYRIKNYIERISDYYSSALDKSIPMASIEENNNTYNISLAINNNGPKMVHAITIAKHGHTYTYDFHVDTDTCKFDFTETIENVKSFKKAIETLRNALIEYDRYFCKNYHGCFDNIDDHFMNVEDFRRIFDDESYYSIDGRFIKGSIYY